MKTTMMMTTFPIKGKIKGIGCDILEIDRIKKSISKLGDSFLSKIFTEKEIIYCKNHKLSYRHFAGRFCGKEAIAKALGTGFGKNLSWLDIEILNDELGKPIVYLCKQRYNDLNKPKFLLSISHCKSYATATAIYF